jgi:hypothetical protein
MLFHYRQASEMISDTFRNIDSVLETYVHTSFQLLPLIHSSSVVTSDTDNHDNISFTINAEPLLDCIANLGDIATIASKSNMSFGI